MQALGLIWGEVDNRAPDYRERSRRLDAPKHSGAVLVLQTWQERGSEDGFRVGRDIPSRTLLPVLRNLGVYEPIDDARDFRVRIAGTAFYRRFGRDVTGARFSELFDPEIFMHNRAVLVQTIESGVPTVIEYERSQGGRAPVRHECLILPVRAPDGVARWALAGLFFHDWVR